MGMSSGPISVVRTRARPVAVESHLTNTVQPLPEVPPLAMPPPVTQPAEPTTLEPVATTAAAAPLEPAVIPTPSPQPAPVIEAEPSPQPAPTPSPQPPTAAPVEEVATIPTSIEELPQIPMFTPASLPTMAPPPMFNPVSAPPMFAPPQPPVFNNLPPLPQMPTMPAMPATMPPPMIFPPTTRVTQAS
eukprot:sb/3471246/